MRHKGMRGAWARPWGAPLGWCRKGTAPSRRVRERTNERAPADDVAVHFTASELSRYITASAAIGSSCSPAPIATGSSSPISSP